MQFFGFQSSLSDIQSVVIGGDGSRGMGFIIDNHSFGGQGSGAPVPIPSTVLLLGFGLLSLAGVRRKK